MAVDEGKGGSAWLATLAAGVGLCSALTGCVGPGLEPPKDLADRDDAPTQQPTAAPGTATRGTPGPTAPGMAGVAGAGATVPGDTRDAAVSDDPRGADGGADDSGVDH